MAPLANMWRYKQMLKDTTFGIFYVMLEGRILLQRDLATQTVKEDKKGIQRAMKICVLIRCSCIAPFFFMEKTFSLIVHVVGVCTFPWDVKSGPDIFVVPRRYLSWCLLIFRGSEILQCMPTKKLSFFQPCWPLHDSFLRYRHAAFEACR